jgi:hypothetical protein
MGKMSKVHDEEIYEEETQMVNRHLKRSLTSGE